MLAACASTSLLRNHAVPQVLLRRWRSVKIHVPSMGESITEGTVQAWKKHPGDRVELDEIIAVIDTDKISVDVNAPVAGWLKKTEAEAGCNVVVGAELCEIDTERGGSSECSKKTVQRVENSAPLQRRRESKEPLSRMRRTIGERLKKAQHEGCLLTTFQECDMLEVMKARKRLAENMKKKHGRNVGFMPFFIKACQNALEEFESLNGAIVEENGIPTLIKRNFVDISIAVSTPSGLVVPVIKDVKDKSMMELEKEVYSLAIQARDGKLSLEQMCGGNFTISNGGIYGSMMGTPIVNPPQSGILGMHSIKDRVMVVDGKIQIRPIMYLALTYDHRVVDGKEAVSFLKSVADQVSEPSALLKQLESV